MSDSNEVISPVRQPNLFLCSGMKVRALQGCVGIPLAARGCFMLLLASQQWEYLNGLIKHSGWEYEWSMSPSSSQCLPHMGACSRTPPYEGYHQWLGEPNAHLQATHLYHSPAFFVDLYRTWPALSPPPQDDHDHLPLPALSSTWATNQTVVTWAIVRILSLYATGGRFWLADLVKW